MPEEQSVDFSDTPSSLGTPETPASRQPDGGNIVPGSDDKGAKDAKKADTPEKPAKSFISDAERLRVENEKLRKGQSTLERRLDTLRQLLGKRQEAPKTPHNQPAASGNSTLYQDEKGNLFTLDASGKMVPYGTGQPTGGDYDEKDTKLAEYELKDNVRGILDEYPNVPDSEKKKILSNPFRWWMYQYPDKTPEQVTVDEVLLDIEYKLMEGFDAIGQTDSKPAAAGKDFRVAPSNTAPQLDLSDSPLQEYTTDDGSYDIEAINSALDRNELSLKDLEKVVKNTPMHEVLRGQKSLSNRGMFKKMI